MTDEETVYEFEKSRGEVVRAIRKRWKGQSLVDLRVFYRFRAVEEWKPSKKGLCLQASQLGELRMAVEALERSLAAENAQPIASGAGENTHAA